MAACPTLKRGLRNRTRLLDPVPGSDEAGNELGVIDEKIPLRTFDLNSGYCF